LKGMFKILAWNDLCDWLLRAQKIGELARIIEPTDWNLQLSGLTYLEGKKKAGSAFISWGIDIIDRLDISPDERKAIYEGNARRLLKLP
jgi:hypothetical protein